MSALTNLQAQVAASEPSGMSHAGDPLLNRAQFIAHQTNANGGHSADLHTLKSYNPGDSAHMVGSTVDRRTSKPFPSQLVDKGADNPTMHPNDVLGIRNKMLGAQPESERPVLGTWKDGANKQVAVDLSTAYGNQHDADTATLQRNEDANFSMKTMEEKPYEEIARERGLGGPRPDKAPGQEEVYRQSVQLNRDGTTRLNEGRNRAANAGARDVFGH